MSELTELTKDELVAAAEQFGVEFKRAMSKADIVERLTEDGVTMELINSFKPVEDEDEEPVAEAAVEAPVVVVVEEEDDEDLTLVVMIRNNGTYQVRGYTFKREHPFALVKSSDADYLIHQDGGFRMATPNEAREYYS